MVGAGRLRAAAVYRACSTQPPHPPHLQKKDLGDRKAMLARRSQIAKRSTAKPQTVGEKLAARAKKFVALRKAEKAKSQPSACA